MESSKCNVSGKVHRVVAILTIVFVATASSFAHHSVTGQYDLSKSLTLTGVITKVEWINPHAYVHLHVKDANGTVSTWALATVPLAMMRKAGLTKEAVSGKPGEMVTIVARPAWDITTRLGWILRITYSDGHFYQLSGQ